MLLSFRLGLKGCRTGTAIHRIASHNVLRISLRNSTNKQSIAN